MDWDKPWDNNRRSGRVLLREPERCLECNRIFLAIYPLRCCEDHEGLDEI